MDRLTAGAHLAATPDDLRGGRLHDRRDAPSRTAEVRRRLDTRTHTWELAAHTLLEAGMSPGEAVRQLALHAPTPDTFAAGVYEIQPDPASAFGGTVREASVPDLVALSERYGLSPTETAEALSTACATPATLVHVIHDRCDADMPATLEACAAVLRPDDVADAFDRDSVVTSLAAARSSGDVDEYEQLRDDLGRSSKDRCIILGRRDHRHDPRAGRPGASSGQGLARTGHRRPRTPAVANASMVSRTHRVASAVLAQRTSGRNRRGPFPLSRVAATTHPSASFTHVTS